MKFNPPSPEELAARVTQGVDDKKKKRCMFGSRRSTRTSLRSSTATRSLGEIDGSSDNLKIFSILELFVGVYVSKSAGSFFWSRAVFKGTFEASMATKGDSGIRCRTDSWHDSDRCQFHHRDLAGWFSDHSCWFGVWN